MDGRFSFLDIAILLLKNKRRIAIHFFCISAFSIGLSYVIPKKYKSTTLFLPPQSEMSNLSPLSLGFSLNLGSQLDFSAQQIETLLGSRSILEKIIHKYGLMRVYKTEKARNNLERALKILRKNIELTTVTQSGLASETVIHYKLSVIDKDKQRSADIANDIVSLLNQTMESLSHTQESYTVSFIKGRLDSVEASKDSVQKALAAFQKTHKIYAPDMREQILASVATFAELKKQKIMSEVERDLLLLDREKSNREVRFAERKIAVLGNEMKKIEENRAADVMPGLNSSVDIGYEYMNLVKESEIQVKLELLLRQQFEEARIKNAKRAPIVRVVDQALPPQWKNSPKKIVVVGVLVSAYMFVLMVFLLAIRGVKGASPPTQKKLSDFTRALSFSEKAE